MDWWHNLKLHRLLECVPRHTPEELDELEKRVRATGRFREPVRVVLNRGTGQREIIDGAGRWEVAKRTGIVPRFEEAGLEDEIDVAGLILDYGTRRNLSAEQKVQMYLDLHEHSERWARDHEEAQARANASRSEKAKVQPRLHGHFATKPAGAVSGETDPDHRQRTIIAAATNTSPATVARVLAKKRSGASKEIPPWKKLHVLVGSAMKSLGAAARLAAALHANELVRELAALQERLHLARVKVDTDAAEGPKDHDTRERSPESN